MAEWTGLNVEIVCWNCVRSHTSLMSIRYNQGFHQLTGKNYAGGGYLAAGSLSTAIIPIGYGIRMASPKS
jgi:hypothetical protein